MTQEMSDSVQPQQTSTAGTILLLAASELQPHLSKKLGKNFGVRTADDLKNASALFKNEQPVLIICGLDGEGWKLIPLLRTAKHNDVPILALANDHETLESIPVIKWAIDRSKKDAIVPLARKLVENPEFIPNDRKKYPPPPPSEEEMRKESKYFQQQIIQESSERLASTAPRNLDSRHPIPDLTKPDGPPMRSSNPPQPGNSPLPEEWEDYLEARVNQIETSLHASLKHAWNESCGHLDRQSDAILALRERIDALATHDETIRSEISDVVEAIAGLQTEKKLSQKRLAESIEKEIGESSSGLTKRMEALDDDVKALSAVFQEVSGAISEDSESSQAKLKEMLELAKADMELASVSMQEQVEGALEMSDWVSSKIEGVEKTVAEIERSQKEADARQKTHQDQMAKRFSTLEGILSRTDALEKVVAGLSPSKGGGPALPAAEIQQLKKRFSTLEQELRQVAAARGAASSAGSVSVDMEAANARFDAIEVTLKGLQTAASADQDRKLMLAQLEDLRLVQTELIDRIEDLERISATGMELAEAEQKADLTEKVRAEITLQLNALRQGQSLLTKRLSKVESRPPEAVTRSDPPPSPAIEEAMRERLRESAVEIQRLTESMQALEDKIASMDSSLQSAEKQRHFDSERFSTAAKTSAVQFTEMEKRFFAVESTLKRVDPKADGEVAWHLGALKAGLDEVARRLTLLENTPHLTSSPLSKHTPSHTPTPAPTPTPSTPPPGRISSVPPGNPAKGRRGRMDSRTMQMPYTVTPVSGPPAPVASSKPSPPPEHKTADGLPEESGKTLEKVRESLAKFQEEYLNRTNEKN